MIKISKIFCTCAVAMSLFTAPSVRAQARAQFDLPSQLLEASLRAVGSQTGTNILFDPPLVEGRQAPALKANLTLDEAFARLLAGAGLKYRFLDDKTVMVISATDSRPVRTQGNHNESGSALRLVQLDSALAATQDSEQGAAEESGRSDSRAGDTKLEEIIVTAQKREERLQDVPISIGVLQGEQLEKAGMHSVQDAIRQVGGVFVLETTGAPGQTQINIRGVAAGDRFLSGSSTVGYYLNETPLAFNRSAFLPDTNAFDLERVEVLRGPQGTLYGGNGLNGVIRVLSKDADLNEFEVKTRTSYTSTKDSEPGYSADAAVNVPLIEGKLAARAVVSYADLGGYVGTATKPDFNDQRIRTYRLNVNAAPTDKLGIEFGAWVSDSQYYGQASGGANYIHVGSSDQVTTPKYGSYYLGVTYELPFGTIESYTGHIDYKNHAKRDLFPFFILTDNPELSLYTEELRFSSNLQGPWRFTGGAFYRSGEDKYHQSINLAFAPFPLKTAYDSKSYAVFGEATRSFWDEKLELTGGLRYYEDKVEGQEISRLQCGTASPTCVTAPDTSASYSRVTWRAVATYHFSDELMMYTSAATGFRPGQVQSPAALFFDPTLPRLVDADELLTYELGVKGSMFNERLDFELIGYHTDWEDSQQQSTVGPGLAMMLNGSRVKGIGYDASVTARLTDRFSVNASLGWNNLEFQSDVRTSSNALLFLEGEKPGNTPEHTSGFGAEYRFPLKGGSLEGFIAGQGYYNTARKDRGLNAQNVVVTTKSDSILNASLRAGVVAADRWTLTVIADNVTNEDGAVVPAPAGAPVNAPRFRPRSFTLQLEADF